MEIGSPLRSSPSLDDQTIYIGAGDGNLYAINLTGDVKWTYQTDGEIIYGSPSLDRYTIYIPSRDGYLYAVYTNGNLKWKKLLIENGYSDDTPSIGPDGTIYLSSFLFPDCSDNFLHAIKPDGSALWTKHSLSKWSNPVISSEGNVYTVQNKFNLPVGSAGNYLIAYNKNGSQLWQTKLNNGGSSILTGTAPALGKYIYVPLKEALYAVNYDGNIKWATTGEAGSVIVGDGVIYIGNRSGELYAVSADTGITLWKFKPSISNPAIWGTPCLGDDGTIYALYFTETDSANGRLYAISADGIDKWYCNVGYMNANSSSPLIYNNTLYVGSGWKGKLYAINVRSAGIANTPWPIFNHDLRRTGFLQEQFPIANFVADNTEGIAPLAVNLTDQSIGEITSWGWEFGDGGIGNEQNPQHIYINSGEYNVKLMVIGPGGSDTKIKANYIIVSDIYNPEPDQNQPVEPDQNQPVMPDQNQPIESDQNQPIETDQNQPIETDQNQPVNQQQPPPGANGSSGGFCFLSAVQY